MMHKLFKIDSKGRGRFWQLEVHEDGKFRSRTGIIDGKEMVSDWTLCEGKNIGRSNETTPYEQALAEAKSKYTNKTDKDWHESLEIAKNTIEPFTPMLANGYPADPDAVEEREKWYKKYEPNGHAVIIQPKFDGLRCIVRKEGVFARSGKPFHTSDHIHDAVAHIFEDHPNLVIDGELYNHDLRDNFNRIISLAKKSKPKADDIADAAAILQIHVYDFFDGDNPELHFQERFEKYAPLLKDIGHPVKLVTTEITLSGYEGLMSELDIKLGQGYEGIMVRLRHTQYEQKRSRSLWKVKKFYDEEYEVVDLIEGKGNWSGKAKRVTFKVGDTTAGAGITGTMEFCADLLANKDKYIGKPVTIKYQELTPDGIPRFGVSKAFYPDGRDT